MTSGDLLQRTCVTPTGELHSQLKAVCVGNLHGCRDALLLSERNLHNRHLVQPLALWRTKQVQGSEETPSLGPGNSPFHLIITRRIETLRKEAYAVEKRLP